MAADGDSEPDDGTDAGVRWSSGENGRLGGGVGLEGFVGAAGLAGGLAGGCDGALFVLFGLRGGGGLPARIEGVARSSTPWSTLRFAKLADGL